MADNSSSNTKSTNDLPTQPIRILGDTRPIRLKPATTGKPKAERGESRPWLLGGLILGTSTLIAIVAVALVVYSRGGFSTLAAGLVAPAPVSAAAPVDESKPSSAVQPPVVNASPTQVDESKPASTVQSPVVNASPAQVNATATRPAATTNVNVPVIVFNFNQTQLNSFTIQLSDLVVLDPSTSWGEVSNYRNLADWATPGTAQALSAAGDQHLSGAGFRSQNTAKGTAMVTSTVHEFASIADAQKSVQIMATDAKTTMTNDLVMQSSLTLLNGARAPVTLVTGSQGTGTYAYFIASYNNMVVDVSTGGFDPSSTGLDALVKDCKTLGQQMLNRIAGAAPLQ
jgi:hypothetical protein